MKTQNKTESYKCNTCGGWIDYTGETFEYKGKTQYIVKHRNAKKGKQCEKIDDARRRTEMANACWKAIERRKGEN